MAIVLPPLPYETDELEPFMSSDTLDLHHGKHHQAYVDKVNALTLGADLADADLETILKVAKTKGDETLLNQAGQVWNHNFFWPCLTPGGGGSPDGELGQMLTRDFGGLKGFQAAFKEEAETHFGSGWAWLVLKGDKLVVTSLHDGETPVGKAGMTPLLTCDVWEHAYYLDYQNKRPEFVDAFLEHLANWSFAAENLARARGQKAA